MPHRGWAAGLQQLEHGEHLQVPRWDLPPCCGGTPTESHMLSCTSTAWLELQSTTTLHSAGPLVPSSNDDAHIIYYYISYCLTNGQSAPGRSPGTTRNVHMLLTTPALVCLLIVCVCCTVQSTSPWWRRTPPTVMASTSGTRPTVSERAAKSMHGQGRRWCWPFSVVPSCAPTRHSSCIIALFSYCLTPTVHSHSHSDSHSHLSDRVIPGSAVAFFPPNMPPPTPPPEPNTPPGQLFRPLSPWAPSSPHLGGSCSMVVPLSAMCADKALMPHPAVRAAAVTLRTVLLSADGSN